MGKGLTPAPGAIEEFPTEKNQRSSSCLACGSSNNEPWAVATDIEYYTTKERFSYWRCCACDCLWIDPVPVGKLDQIYPPNYYSYNDDATSIIGRVKNRVDQQMFRSLLGEVQGKALRALDIGGGCGGALDLLKVADTRIAGTVVVDLDDGAKRVAESRGHIFFHGGIEKYDSDNLYDVILMLNLIEHVANPADVLLKAKALLRPGGRILLKTPNWRSLDHFLFRHRSWGGYHCPRHWVLWTLPGFQALSESCGFEVLSANYTQGAPFWAVSVLDVLKNIGLVSVTPERPACAHPLFGALCGLFAAVDFLRRPFSNPSQMVFVLTRPD